MKITQIVISTNEDHSIFVKEDSNSSYMACKGFNQQIKLGNPYVDKSDADYKISDIEHKMEFEDGPMKGMQFDLEYNFIASNGLNLNPVLVEHNNGDEIPGSVDILILIYGSDFKYLRSIIGSGVEIVNTFHNKDGAHGCIIAYPHDYVLDSIIKSESKGPNNDFWHLGVEIVNDKREMQIIHNRVKKPEIVTDLAKIADKKRRIGILASTKRVLPQAVFCLYKDKDTCTAYIENCESNPYIKQYNMYVLPDNVLDGEPIPKEILDTITASKVRAGFLWNMNDVPYEAIKELHLLYIFTAGKTKTVKCTKSN